MLDLASDIMSYLVSWTGLEREERATLQTPNNGPKRFYRDFGGVRWHTGDSRGAVSHRFHLRYAMGGYERYMRASLLVCVMGVQKFENHIQKIFLTSSARIVLSIDILW